MAEEQINILGVNLKISWLSKVIRTDCPESAEKLLALGSGAVLWVIAIAFTVLALWQGFKLHDITSSVMTGLLAIAGYLALFAKLIHNKEQPAPGDGNGP